MQLREIARLNVPIVYLYSRQIERCVGEVAVKGFYFSDPELFMESVAVLSQEFPILKQFYLDGGHPKDDEDDEVNNHSLILSTEQVGKIVSLLPVAELNFEVLNNHLDMKYKIDNFFYS